MLVYASLLLEGDDRWHAVKLYMFLAVELTHKKLCSARCASAIAVTHRIKRHNCCTSGKRSVCDITGKRMMIT